MSDTQRVPDNRLPPAEGSLIEVELRRGEGADTLNSKSAGIRTGGAKLDQNNNRVVSLYVPDAARPALEAIVENYISGDLTQRGNPPNQAKVEAIEAFRMARLETVWTDDPAELPRDPNHVMWWGVWCFKGSEAKIEAACAALEVRASGDDWRLKFPEVTVIPVLASRAAIELMLFATGAIAELRRGSENPTFFLDEPRGDAYAWIEDLAERVIWPGGDAPSVCVLDTGINRGHALIEPALATADLHAIDPAWGGDDHGAHGTLMGGMALHGDLTVPLSDREERHLTHRLESVKILPPPAFPETDPRSYGIVTQAAVALPEITAPDRPRVYCMAITHENVSGSVPSSWSAAIDQAAAGTMAGDGEPAPKRLIVLSAGNVPPLTEMRLIGPQSDYPIENPSQAWNALTIGCYTDRIEISDAGFDDWTPMVDAGNLSPHSRTSEAWPQNAPFKPELVMEGGNRAIDAARAEASNLASLSLLSTGSSPATPLASFAATSAASAQAARLAARLAADHPEFWPETIRALMIHSAEWTLPMLQLFDGVGGYRDRYGLVRRFGYGVPDYERATASARDSLALFAQTEIQPFRFAGGRKFGDCHYYDLPIPRRMLEELYNEEVELKITLSYFVDPNPGMAANIEPQRYQSHGLRFDLRRRNEAVDIFKQRVNPSERDDWRVGPNAPGDDTRWMLGPMSVAAGSVHCDVWRGPAIELLDRNMLCVKPVVGWCRERASREICDMTRRYALIVTLKAKNQNLDIYTPISTAIGVPVPVEVDAAPGRGAAGDLFDEA
ncbi:MAG: S8 family peptidase [Sphingomonadales bacterium]|nr:MAG: S8 family peptidase [Sphingomonadales bacterium]